MLRKIRERIQSEESGFTLIELLVVILIIGILAAIAIPAFLGQREKAQDSEAKSAVRNAASAAGAFYTDNQTYAAMTPAALQSVEPSLNDARGLVVANNNATDYDVTVTSQTGATFTIQYRNGRVTRTCGPAARVGKGGCKTGATW